MKVTLLLFAELREKLNQEEGLRELPEETTVESFVRAIFEKNGLEWGRPPVRYALNERFVGGEKRLRDKDELAILSPVSGG